MEEHLLKDIAISLTEILSIVSKKKFEILVKSSETAASHHTKMHERKDKTLMES